MFIPTIYIENIKSENKSIEISSNKLHHLKNVLRIKDDTKVKISNGKGKQNKSVKKSISKMITTDDTTFSAN